MLHLDFYRDDAIAPSWPDWISTAKFKRTAPDRGIRFQRVTQVLDAMLANAGLTICGLALISALVDDGRISLPFPISSGSWTAYAFQARFRPHSLVRPQVHRFRDWLLGESAKTRDWLKRTVNQTGEEQASATAKRLLARAKAGRRDKD